MTFIRNTLAALLLAGFACTANAAPVDINTATAAELAQAIKGVGDKKAAAIVEFRKANGPFKSVDDLAKVPGIGDKTIDANRANLTVGGAATGMPAMPATPAAPAKPAMPAAPAAPAPVKPAMPAAPAAPAKTY